MVAHRNDKTGMNERGALMIEAIALLGLMTMMSPMVVRQTADRTSEMEEVAIAGQIKELKDALSNWITSNYASEANTLNGSHTAVNKKSISASDLAPYLSSSMIDGTNFRGNKLIDNYKLGVRQVCIEKQDTTSPTYATSPCNGADCGLSATIKCSRYKMTGVVLSDSGSQEIDDRRATRIASMVGADGGYMRTSKVSTALSVDKKKLLGTQGIWEGDVSDYFDDASVNTDVGGRVAATTVYAEGFAGDYLYRKPNSMPGANSMFTTLDMGGANENCDNGTNGACHQIKNAGGLEVVGGKIIIRSQNTGAGNDQSTDTNTPIVLGSDAIQVNMEGKSTLDMAGNSFKVKTTVAGTDLTATLNLTGNNVSMSASNSEFKLTGQYANLNARDFEANIYEGRTKLFMNMTEVNLAKNDGGYLLLKNAVNPEVALHSSGKMDLSASGNIGATAGTNMNLSANDAMALSSDRFMNLSVNSAMYLKAASGKTKATLDNDHIGLLIKAQANGDDATAPSKFLLYHNSAHLVTKDHAEIATDSADLHLRQNEAIIQAFGPDYVSYANFSNTGAELHHTAPSGQSTFRLEPASAVISAYTNFSSPSNLTLDETALTLLQNTAKMDFISRNEGAYASLILNNGDASRGPRLGIYNSQKNDGVHISFYPDSGRIGGSFFQPEDKIWNGSAWVNIVQQRAKLAINNLEESGRMKSSIADISGGSNASVIIDAEARNGGPAPYNVHKKDPHYDRFRVDPAFISVMNDIKITSRGGARLSEALPNYILKGIYVLSNSYRSGRWPCGNDTTNEGTCSFKMPYYTPADLGLTSGGEEFNCDGFNSGTHPAHSCKCENSGAPNTNSGGCDASTKFVTFDLYNDGGNYYIESDENYRWAHPFMGNVPAPGKYVTTKIGSGSNDTEKLYATDEGPCPDGYQAVMTVTPNAFEISRLLSVNPIYQKAFGSDEIKAYYTEYDGSNFTNVAANGSNYNYGYLPPDNDTNRTATSIIQGGSRVGIVADSLGHNGKPCSGDGECGTKGIYGWRVAMGTITPTNANTSGFIWNFGGIPADSWSAIAHTYCYFNPDRFTMPNMTFIKTDGTKVNTNTDDVLITPMDNPLLESGYMD